MRLDQFLVDRGYFLTRTRARDAILRGAVMIGGRSVLKPSQNVEGEVDISVNDAASGYVSRAALKLIHALDHFGIDVAVDLALDLGASTGGFTQVLLERGARRVVAVDVGHGQLSSCLRSDPRVTLLEGLNARDLTPDHLPGRPEIVTCDTSFISLKLTLPRALDLAAPGARLIALVKPQFEAGCEALRRSGGIRDQELHSTVCNDVATWLARQNPWRPLGIVPSPILGGDGNREFLLAAEKER
jgi:23S rRNA (cytidine1920-2'-O)/16S rRNA (cytidine1409-2'-O)-methyltransferase